MKKLICGLSALMLMTSPLSAYADTVITESTAQKGETQLAMDVAPAYVLTIPADTTVKEGAVSTKFGSVVLTEARVEPGKCLLISVEGDYALKNKADETKTIPYDVTVFMTDVDGETYEESTKKYGFYGIFGKDTAELTIHISEEDWENAPAGSYSDVLTFRIKYTDIPK